MAKLFIREVRLRINKEEYWRNFVEYAFEKTRDKEFLQTGFPTTMPTDRNWYALRLGTSKAHIELSFNTQKNSIRAALLIKERNLLNALEELLNKNGLGNIVSVKKDSKTANISFTKLNCDFENGRDIQFQWFMDKTCILKKMIDAVL